MRVRSMLVGVVLGTGAVVGCADSSSDAEPDIDVAETAATPTPTSVAESSVAESSVEPPSTGGTATSEAPSVSTSEVAADECALLTAGELGTVFAAEFVADLVEDLGDDGYYCSFDRADGAAVSVVVARLPIDFDTAVASDEELTGVPPTELDFDGGRAVRSEDEISATLIAERGGVVVSAIVDVFGDDIDGQLVELAGVMLD